MWRQDGAGGVGGGGYGGGILAVQACMACSVDGMGWGENYPGHNRDMQLCNLGPVD